MVKKSKPKDTNRHILLVIILIAFINMNLAAFLLFIFCIYMTATILKIDVNFKRYKNKKMLGGEGERRVNYVLQSLNIDKIVLNKLNLDAYGEKCRINHVLITKKGIINIETKNYPGIIKADSNENLFYKIGKSREDISEIILQVKACNDVLTRILPFNFKVYNLIVISNPNTIIENETSNIPIININYLEQYIDNFMNSNEEKDYDIEKIANTILIHKNNLPDINLKHINSALKDNKSFIGFTGILLFMIFIAYSIVNLPNKLINNINSETFNELYSENIVPINKEIDIKELGVGLKVSTISINNNETIFEIVMNNHSKVGIKTDLFTFKVMENSSGKIRTIPFSSYDSVGRNEYKTYNMKISDLSSNNEALTFIIEYDDFVGEKFNKQIPLQIKDQ